MKYQGILSGAITIVLVAGALSYRKEPEPAIIEEHTHRDPFVFQPTKPAITIVVTSTSNNGLRYGDVQQYASDLIPSVFHSIIK